MPRSCSLGGNSGKECSLYSSTLCRTPVCHPSKWKKDGVTALITLTASPSFELVLNANGRIPSREREGASERRGGPAERLEVWSWGVGSWGCDERGGPGLPATRDTWQARWSDSFGKGLPLPNSKCHVGPRWRLCNHFHSTQMARVRYQSPFSLYSST